MRRQRWVAQPVGANAVIESGVQLGDNVVIGAGRFVGKNSKIGAGSRQGERNDLPLIIQIGENCPIQSSTVMARTVLATNDRGNWVKIPTIRRVIIGDRVETAVPPRPWRYDTAIGNGVIIDNQRQIAHNVVIGDNTAVAGGVIMAAVEDFAVTVRLAAPAITGIAENMPSGNWHGYGDASHHGTGASTPQHSAAPNKVWRKRCTGDEH